MATPVYEVIPEQEVYFYYDQQGDLDQMLGRRLTLFVSMDGTYAVTEGFHLLEHNLQRIKFSRGVIAIDDRILVLQYDVEINVSAFNLQNGEHLYGYVKLVPFEGVDTPCEAHTIEILVSKNEQELQCPKCYKFFEFKRFGNKLHILSLPKRALFVNLSANLVDVIRIANQGEQEIPYNPVNTVFKVFLNGILLEENTDYTLDRENRKVRFNRHLDSGDVVIVKGTV